MTLGALIAVLSLAAPPPILAQGTPHAAWRAARLLPDDGAEQRQVRAMGGGWRRDSSPDESGMAFRPGRAGEAGHSDERVGVTASTAARTLGAKLRETTPTGLSAVAGAALKAGRLAQGVEVTLADGQTLPFGPPK